MQQHQIALPFARADMVEAQRLAGFGQTGEFVVVGREQAAAADLGMHRLGHRPGQRQAVIGRGAAPDLIKDHEAAGGRLRQNALIVLLAQAGCFVPSSSARIGLVDRLFSRVGAADNLARGRSTFMVEMVETAAILAQATSRSFVILDEVGRGTSTYDGLALAWAVAEAVHSQIRCRCLFATHYHELARLAETCEALSLHHVRAREWQGDLVLLHELADGPADRS